MWKNKWFCYKHCVQLPKQTMNWSLYNFCHLPVASSPPPPFGPNKSYIAFTKSFRVHPGKYTSHLYVGRIKQCSIKLLSRPSICRTIPPYSISSLQWCSHNAVTLLHSQPGQIWTTQVTFSLTRVHKNSWILPQMTPACLAVTIKWPQIPAVAVLKYFQIFYI